MLNLLDRIPSKFRDYKIQKIYGGASKRVFFRFSRGSDSVICMDSHKEIEEYKNYLNIYSIISKINISIPNIYHRNDQDSILILEDFGKLRFDKILSNYSIKDLLDTAVKTLLVLNNEIDINNMVTLEVYNFEKLKIEISEFIDYFYPYFFKKNISNELKNEFYECWKNNFESIDFNFKNFVHKDYNLNNLIYLKSRKNHLKCGVLDFQSAFIGENCWDLFSLLEDSRNSFDDKYNDYFIEYFYNNSLQNININNFKKKYYFLNLSRQTRLLGRWIKFSFDFGDDWYLKFIPITKMRLLKGIKKLNNESLRQLYSKFFVELQ